MYTFLFFFNDTATTEIYTLSLHDALPIYAAAALEAVRQQDFDLVVSDIVMAGAMDGIGLARTLREAKPKLPVDRKSTRLNSSHANISYAVFCLKKKKTPITSRPI